ncbi:hypothetical protein GCM10022245_21010 [Streptomyces mayteni]
MALREFGLVAEQRREPLESRSGAGVHPVRTAEGEAAYLKVVPRGSGARVLADARRELRFYRSLAPVVPVRTPRLLAWSDGGDAGDGVAVLLSSAGESLDVGRWTVDMWTRLGGALAALHGVVPEAPGDWARSDPLLDALAGPPPAEIAEFWGESLPGLPELIAGRAELRELLLSVGATLVHGDCHAGNVVHDAGAPALCDWQAVGIGRPTADLAFLSVRATPSGTVVPGALLDAYLDGRPGDRRALTRALVAEELAVYVFQWPGFAGFNSPAGNEHVRRRARELAARYLGEAAQAQGRRVGPVTLGGAVGAGL